MLVCCTSTTQMESLNDPYVTCAIPFQKVE